MRAVWEAIERRFEGDKSLVGKVRKLYFGLDDVGDKSPPYTDMVIENQNADLDTFDADLESYSLQFKVHTQDIRGPLALDIVEHLRRVFDDGLLSSDAFADAPMQFVSASGPVLEAETPFAAQVTYKVTVQRTIRTPVVRAG